MTDSLGIVLPAYRPDSTALTRYISALNEVLAPEVIRVEIDTPSDRQLAALDSTVAEVNAVSRKRGKGGAIMDGFDSLETDVVAFADADGSVPAASLAAILDPIRTGATDLSIGSRRHPDSEIVAHQTVVRRFLGDAFAFAARQLLPTACRDYQCGAKAVTAEAWNDLKHYCYEPGFAWDIEFVSVAGSLGYRITEVPVTWEDHPDSTVDPLPTAIELASVLVELRERSRTLIPRHRHRNRQPTTRSRRVDRQPSEQSRRVGDDD